MKILITRPLDEQIVDRGLGPDVVYGPELASSPEQLLSTMSEHRPAVLVAEEIAEPWVKTWRELSGGRPIAVIGGDGAANARGCLECYGVELLSAPREASARDAD